MKLSKYFLGIVFLFSTLSIFGQFKITGQITDAETQESLIGVSIYLTNLKTGTVTDVYGNFEISNLKKGTYMLIVSYTGYKTISTTLILTADTVLNFAMHSTATELSEVVVTGVARTTELKRNPIVVASMEPRIFKENTATNLVDALTQIPGLSQITTGTNISKPVIRGLSHNRIITLNNGIRQEGQQWGDEHGIEMDEYAVERAEVIKGPGSLLYGSDGIGGVINFLPAKPPSPGKTQTQWTSNYQSNNHFIGNSLSHKGNKNGLHWAGRFSNKIAGNYKNKYDGRVHNSGYQEFNGSLSMGIIKNWGHSTLTASSYNALLGIVEGERDSLGNFVFENENGREISATQENLKGYPTDIPYQWVNHINVASNNYLLLGKGSLHADIGFQNNRRREFEEAETPKEPGLYLALNTLNYNIRYNANPTNGWENSIGISGMWQINQNKGEEFLIPDYDLFDIGAFVFTQKKFGNLSIAAGLRFDNRHINSASLFLNEDNIPVHHPNENSTTKFTEFQKNFNGISGSVGMAYQLSEISTLKFHLSNGYRAPNIAELASNGKHEGTFRYEIGNHNLKPEFSHQVDVAYSLHSEHTVLEISPFINYIQNFIFLEKLPYSFELAPPDNPLPAFQYTHGDATITGAEVYFDFHPHPLDWLHIENSFSLIRATKNRQTDRTKYLPFMPPPRYRGGIKAEFKEVNTYISQFYIKFYVEHNFAQNQIYSAFGTETSTPGYTLLSAGIGVHFHKNKKKDFIELYLSSENLLNSTYQNHLSRLKYAPTNPYTNRNGVFNMGRNFSIKLIFKI